MIIFRYNIYLIVVPPSNFDGGGTSALLLGKIRLFYKRQYCSRQYSKHSTHPNPKRPNFQKSAFSHILIQVVSEMTAVMGYNGKLCAAHSSS